MEQEPKQPGAWARSSQSAGYATDSPWAYFLTHTIVTGYNFVKYAAVCGLAVWFDSPWVLLAVLVVPWTQYKHDFGKSHNNEADRRVGANTETKKGN